MGSVSNKESGVWALIKLYMPGWKVLQLHAPRSSCSYRFWVGRLDEKDNSLKAVFCLLIYFLYYWTRQVRMQIWRKARSAVRCTCQKANLPCISMYKFRHRRCINVTINTSEHDVSLDIVFYTNYAVTSKQAKRNNHLKGDKQHKTCCHLSSSVQSPRHRSNLRLALTPLEKENWRVVFRTVLFEKSIGKN